MPLGKAIRENKIAENWAVAEYKYLEKTNYTMF